VAPQAGWGCHHGSVVFRLIRRVVGGIFALVVLYLSVTFVQVWWASRQDDRTPASAIVVLGAAQYNGEPSPVLQARLDHAAELWEAGVAPVIVVTGGKQEGDRVNEGYASYDELRDQGIPESALKVEVDGTNTYEQLSAAQVIVDDLGTGEDVVVVSSPYHSFRSSGIAGEVGLVPHTSPSEESSSLSSLTRETLAVSLGRLVSYRRLANWMG
jgi:uncharacterized SAM-binding protein YcdF (DUF218 family)